MAELLCLGVTTFPFALIDCEGDDDEEDEADDDEDIGSGGCLGLGLL